VVRGSGTNEKKRTEEKRSFTGKLAIKGESIKTIRRRKTGVKKRCGKEASTPSPVSGEVELFRATLNEEAWNHRTGDSPFKQRKRRH